MVFFCHAETKTKSLFFRSKQTSKKHTHTKQKVVYCVIGFAFVGMIPTYRLRRAMNDIVFKHTFRMITRSISGVVRFHHPEYKPKNCGFCVANHTTPIDIAILSTDCTYSLVRCWASVY